MTGFIRSLACITVACVSPPPLLALHKSITSLSHHHNFHSPHLSSTPGPDLTTSSSFAPRETTTTTIMSDQEQSVLRKISSTSSLRDENTMKKNIACLYEDSKWNTSHESLLANLERFLKSVNTMSHVVMVPSRLLDIEGEEEDSSTSSSASDTSSNSGVESMNMYESFRLLSEAKDDLIWGTSRDRDNTTLINNDDVSNKFKYHLNALNGLVAHFADLADELTIKYQTQIEGMD